MKSILENARRCFICNRKEVLQKHHIIGGPRRTMSEKNGLWVYLCPTCHARLHNDPTELRNLRKICETKWLSLNNNDLDKWMRLVGTNYLDLIPSRPKEIKNNERSCS